MHNPNTFFLFFISMWLGVLIILSYGSGWKELARYYRYQNEGVSKKRYCQWANVGGVSYKGCMTIGGNEQGLYLSILFLFSFGSSSLFIPWKDIRIVKKRYWWFPVLELSIVQAPSVKIRVAQSMENFLQEVYGRPLSIEGA